MSDIKSCENCEHRRGTESWDRFCARYQTACRWGALDKCGLKNWTPRYPWWFRIIRRVLGIGGLLAAVKWRMP